MRSKDGVSKQELIMENFLAALDDLDTTRRDLQKLALDIMEFNKPLARILVDTTNQLMRIDQRIESQLHNDESDKDTVEIINPN